MFARAMTILLVAAIATTGAAAQEEATAVERAPALATGWQAEVPARASLTSEEEREARELAVLFVRRFNETNDIAPIVDELFVKHFEEYLRQSSDEFPMEFVRPAVALQAADDDLRRFFIAEFNFTCLSIQHWLERSRQQRLAGAEYEEGASIMDVYPPEALDILRRDLSYALLRERIDAEEREASAGDASDSAPDPQFIESLEQMRGWTRTMEKVNSILRDSLPDFPTQLAFEKDSNGGESTYVGWEEGWDSFYSPQLTVLDKESYGFPEGTRLIHMNLQSLLLLQFNLEMTRVDGRLRVVSATPELDGD